MSCRIYHKAKAPKIYNSFLLKMDLATSRDPNAFFEAHISRAVSHSSKKENKQALREYKEAARIRPSEVSLKKTIRTLENEMLQLSPEDLSIPFERIASPFNLCVRYWDRGMHGAALKEGYQALESLSRAGLPVTCALHNIEIIKQIMPQTRKQEADLRKLVAGKKKNNLPLNYKLATMYFDRRMLQAAEAQLKRCKELSQTLLELELTKKSVSTAAKTTRECDSRCSSRRSSMVEEQVEEYDESRLVMAKEKISGIIDDILHVRELESLYCTLTNEVKILPCLLSRFREDVTECEQWWTEIRTSGKLIW